MIYNSAFSLTYHSNTAVTVIGGNLWLSVLHKDTSAHGLEQPEGVKPSTYWLEDDPLPAYMVVKYNCPSVG